MGLKRGQAHKGERAGMLSLGWERGAQGSQGGAGVPRAPRGQVAGATGLPRDLLLARPQCPSLHCLRRVLWGLPYPWFPSRLRGCANCSGKTASSQAPCQQPLILLTRWVTLSTPLGGSRSHSYTVGTAALPYPRNPHPARGSLPRARCRANAPWRGSPNFNQYECGVTVGEPGLSLV